LTTDRPDVDDIKTHEHRFFYEKFYKLWRFDQSCKECVYTGVCYVRYIPCYKMTHGTEANVLLYIFMFSVLKLIDSRIMYRGVSWWPVINKPKWMSKSYCSDFKVLYSPPDLIWRRCAAHLSAALYITSSPQSFELAECLRLLLCHRLVKNSKRAVYFIIRQRSEYSYANMILIFWHFWLLRRWRLCIVSSVLRCRLVF
jgi:hypothetical protein